MLENNLIPHVYHFETESYDKNYLLVKDWIATLHQYRQDEQIIGTLCCKTKIHFSKLLAKEVLYCQEFLII